MILNSTSDRRRANRFGLLWKITRGRAKKISLTFSQTQADSSSLTGWTTVPYDISQWSFFFTVRSNYALKQSVVALGRNPIANQGDPSQGQLLWWIEAADTELLVVGNYVFDVGYISNDRRPYALCGGTIALLDSVTDPATI